MKVVAAAVDNSFVRFCILEVKEISFKEQEFVRPRWPYDMRPSVRAEKYMCHCNSLGGAT